MPEGDTIFRAARTLHRALAGTVVTSFDSVFPKLTRVHVDTPITGRTIESVTASGKHLLMAFSGGLVLRTHMRMNGSWHIYRPGERWQRGRGDMRIVIATAGYVAVGFNIPVAEWLKAGALERHPELRRLGPDLLAEDFDAQEATRRVRATPDAEISDVLLNQRVMAGIGNVYKSEVLFACRVDPFAAVRTLSDEQVACLVTTARRFLRDNVSEGLAAIPTPGPRTSPGFRRTTRRDHPGERLWVYGRAGEPCRRCGTPVKIAKQGRGPRLTYWCPQCQS
ncbi:MAG TPA: DNA-formamidopyrimidine glycosylase family protein [Vicinamibacterales bacterium]|nr:DNA-formamidopyrimidine glycosylase family protein [Vicinamibacterales bacterium]